MASSSPMSDLISPSSTSNFFSSSGVRCGRVQGLGLFALGQDISDDLRWEFVQDHLKSIHQAMEQGVKVGGYLYWSLLDNFEWDKGFKPRFGMIEVDYATQKRTVRESAKRFAQVCKTGVLDER